ncbi:hypothetical protein ANN_02038 [Periplaneta americana]|uniref:Uncharacterized protein n=1 Tax=Periplaneta americana TaxID=6978 RepID=A0ABQ8TV64_PERAM|nr:hypothetical protein ANN_02038 [Periplaneta americana]
MAGLCEGGNEPPGSLKAREKEHLLRTFEKETKERLVKCFVWSVALYGTETWKLRRSEEKRLESFEMKLHLPPEARNIDELDVTADRYIEKLEGGHSPTKKKRKYIDMGRRKSRIVEEYLRYKEKAPSSGT